eukprot:12426604-Alexandrium_andersonii.AAC.1
MERRNQDSARGKSTRLQECEFRQNASGTAYMHQIRQHVWQVNSAARVRIPQAHKALPSCNNSEEGTKPQ